jgi:signal transduction histidine kinase
LNTPLATAVAAAQKIRTIFDAQESERGRIARELHDGVGQRLALLQMSLSMIAADEPSSALQSQLKDAQRQVAEIARELHDISAELHPARLQLLGLAGSLDALCHDSSQQSPVGVTFTCDESQALSAGDRESLCVYRIAQEALQNIFKHSGATRAAMHLARRHGMLQLTVTDNGRGFDASVPSTGLGLTSMRQRAAVLKGRVSIHPRDGGGTCVRAEIPFTPDSVVVPHKRTLAR